jgi:hypothetical protein
MRSISSRLRRLEASASGASGRCPECGLMPQGPGYIVIRDDICGEVRDPAPHIPEVCPRCSRTTRFYIHVVYDDESGAGLIEVGDTGEARGRGPE